jgi:hypothetical protein
MKYNGSSYKLCSDYIHQHLHQMPMCDPSTASKATPTPSHAGEKRSNPVRIFQFVSYSADNYSTPKPDLAIAQSAKPERRLYRFRYTCSFMQRTAKP